MKTVIYINLCKLFVNVQMKNLQPVVEKNEKCKLYRMLGITCGAFLGIVLI